jgi:hypothetical protein
MTRQITFGRPRGTLAVSRSGHTATLLANGSVLVAGGSPYLGLPTQTAETYGQATNAWSLTDPSHQGRVAHTATRLPNGHVVLIGGGSGSGTPPIASIEAWFPTSSGWVSQASLRAARSNHTATLLPNQQILVVGGINSTQTAVLSSAELFAEPPLAAPVPALGEPLATVFIGLLLAVGVWQTRARLVT